MPKILIFKNDYINYGINNELVEDMELAVNINKTIFVEDYIKGIDSYKGNIIALIDLNQKFFKMSTNIEYSGKIVIDEKDISKAFLISEFLEIITYDNKALKGFRGSKFIKGILQHKGKEIFVLSDDIINAFNKDK